MGRLKFCLFGDSLTQRSYASGGWGARLTSLYARQADITLRGYSGYNTRWALQILNDDDNFPETGRKLYDLVTLWFGANDAALSDRSGARQHVPLREYQQNLSDILKRLQLVSKHILLITPPPVDESARIRQIASYGEGEWLPERTQDQTARYAEAAEATAQSCGVPVLNVYSRLKQLPHWEALQDDGLHFNSAGQEKVFDILLEAIWRNFPHLRLETLLPDYPLNMDIDADDYHQSFNKHAEQKLAAEQQKVV